MELLVGNEPLRLGSGRFIIPIERQDALDSSVPHGKWKERSAPRPPRFFLKVIMHLTQNTVSDTFYPWTGAQKESCLESWLSLGFSYFLHIASLASMDGHHENDRRNTAIHH